MENFTAKDFRRLVDSVDAMTVQEKCAMNYERKDEYKKMNGVSPRRPLVSIHWFRNGLRLHDNPALLDALKDCDVIYPVFIFDGEVSGTAVAKYNRIMFLLESLRDLDEQFKKVHGRLFCFRGPPQDVLQELFQKWKVGRLTFEEEPEAIWHERDHLVREVCAASGIQCITRVSHTLWCPKLIINLRDYGAPVTFDDFRAVVNEMGSPKRPAPTADFSRCIFLTAPDHDVHYGLPSLEEMRCEMDCREQGHREYLGGETRALELFQRRMIDLAKDESNCSLGKVDLLAPSTSLSAYLRHGCLSIRKFFWAVHDLFTQQNAGVRPPLELTGQLLWREFFYVMSHQHTVYNKMVGNPVCLQIPWYSNPKLLSCWKDGRTGYPWIDAGMRQLKREGWVHHVVRHAVACFLTRGTLWLNWEEGAKVFCELLIDGDWAINAGNWMWVSSSAFEQSLDHPTLLDPVSYGRQMDPQGDYVRKYVPELRHFPTDLLFSPWKADYETQRLYGCVLGKDYPRPCVDHEIACARNNRIMEQIRYQIHSNKTRAPHVAPSSSAEVVTYARLPESLMRVLQDERESARKRRRVE